MSTEQPSTEISGSTIVSRSPGLAYERMRERRTTRLSQPLANKLAVEGALLVALAAALSLAVGFDALSVGGSSVGLVALAAGAGAVVAAAVTGHVAVATYRLLEEPITEREALALLAVEDAASYLGIVTGGLLALVTLAAALAGAVSGPGGAAGPTAAAAPVALGLAVAAGLTLAAGRYVDGRLPRTT